METSCNYEKHLKCSWSELFVSQNFIVNNITTLYNLFWIKKGARRHLQPLSRYSPVGNIAEQCRESSQR